MASPLVNPRVQEAVQWYAERRLIYEALASKVEAILREVLSTRSIDYHSISSRAKSLESYRLKASREKYEQPRNEIMDMAGIRVITYTQSDATKVANCVRELFTVLPGYSIDKSEELGTDRVGYRSIHFLATLGKSRERLPENRALRKMRFETQVRTILQHAWAEFEHDRNYKFAGVLPNEIRRRVSVIAGNLEMTDREFDAIAKEIDKYAVTAEREANSGNLSSSIDSMSLIAYLNKKLAPLVRKGARPSLNLGDKTIIDELHLMGINTIKELDAIVPKDFVDIESRFVEEDSNFLGFMRDIMIAYDADRYFKKAWRHHWSADTSDVELLEELGVSLAKYAKKYKIEIK